MPTYEYACSACGNEWEQTQRITEPPVEQCPKCAKATAHRLISGGTNFILKGGGWYSDLYASPKAEKASDKTEKSSDNAQKSTGAAAPAEKSGTKAETTSAPSSPPAAAPTTASSS
jgi:putative FmdB family regulatory protein